MNYALRSHWENLSLDQQGELDRALKRHFGPTQTAYEALLHFGLQELHKRNRLSEFPNSLRQLKVVARGKHFSDEIAQLDVEEPAADSDCTGGAVILDLGDSRGPQVKGDQPRKYKPAPRRRDRALRWLATIWKRLIRRRRH